MRASLPAVLLAGLAAAGVAVALYSVGRAGDDPRSGPAPAAAASDGDRQLARRVETLEWEVARLRSRLEAQAERDAAAPAPAPAPSPGPAAVPSPSATEVEDPFAARIGRLESAAIARVTRAQAALRLAEATDHDVREAAVADLVGLARRGDRESLDLLVAALGSGDARLRDGVVEGIGSLRDPAHLPLLAATAREDESSRVRAEAAEALRAMPPDRAGPVLVDLLGDESRRVVHESVEALGRLAWRPAAPELLRLAGGDDLDLAVRSARSLMSMGDASGVDRVLPRLAARLSESDAGVRRGVLRDMRRLDAEAARPYFERALEDGDQWVRREAERGLEDLDREE